MQAFELVHSFFSRSFSLLSLPHSFFFLCLIVCLLLLLLLLLLLRFLFSCSLQYVVELVEAAVGELDQVEGEAVQHVAQTQRLGVATQQRGILQRAHGNVIVDGDDVDVLLVAALEPGDEEAKPQVVRLRMRRIVVLVEHERQLTVLRTPVRFGERANARAHAPPPRTFVLHQLFKTKKKKKRDDKKKESKRERERKQEEEQEEEKEEGKEEKKQKTGGRENRRRKW